VFWWRVKAIDKLGSESTWSALRKITVDNAAPTVSIDSYSVYAGKLSVKVTGKDELSGVSRVGVNLYNASNAGSAVLSLKTEDFDHAATAQIEVKDVDVSGLSAGEYTIRAVSKDAVGNYSSQALQKITIEKAPVIIMDKTLSGTVVRGTVSSKTASLKVFIDGVERADIAMEVGEIKDGVYPWRFVLPADATVGGIAHAVRVTATVAGLDSSDDASFIIPSENHELGITSDTKTTQEVAQAAERLSRPLVISSLLGATHAVQPEVVKPSEGVLGEQTAKADEPAIGTAVETVAAVPTESGWKIFEVLWYWWVLLATVAGAVMALIRRRIVTKNQ